MTRAMPTPIYLDYNATTPIDPAVLAAMTPYLAERFGNPSSAHAYGRAAREAVEGARVEVAALLGATPEEIVFTGGGSEASNTAIKGIAFRALEKSAPGDVHVITSTVEHPATLEPCAFLERLGVRVTRVPVDGTALVDLDALRRALDRSTLLVSVIHAQNEVGTLQPIQEIAALVHARGALLHIDAAQSAGKIPVDVRALGADLASLAGHKLYAPKGVGALYVRDGLALEPLVHGGGQESGRRAGPENVPYAVALGAACGIARRALPESEARVRSLRDRLWTRLRDAFGDRIVLNGHPERRLPNTLHLSFLDHIGAELLASVPEIAASTGSACHEGHVELSPVLVAMGMAPEVGRGAVRLSLGRFTTTEEIDRAAALLAREGMR